MLTLPPRWMMFVGAVAAMALVIPPVVIARVRATPDPNRAVHIFFDMDFQPKFKTQAVNPLFADGRTQRPAVLGTVARGETQIDTHRFEGVVDGQWATTLPAGMTMSQELLDRGQQRYNIYCSVCHGYAGFGDGAVNKRAMELMSSAEGPANGTAWVQAKSLHDPQVREHALGMLYSIATNGIRNMAGYGTQIDLEDRWAIAAYVKALQLSQNASLQDVPPELRDNLKKGEVK
jgi:mono/diheme cytochrome c family protein